MLSSSKKKLLDNLDWDCGDQYHQRSSLNIIHWYPASFITAIPGNVIDVFTEEGDVIWDPFCGSGTTAVEAYRKGRIFYGSDLNEIAMLISQAKVNVLNGDTYFHERIKIIQSDVKDLLDTNRLFNKNDEHVEAGKELVQYEELKQWYNKHNLNELCLLWGFLQRYKSEAFLWPILAAVYLNIAKITSSQDKTWGHIADNVKPNHEQLSKVKGSVITAFNTRLKQIVARSEKVYMSSKNGSATFTIADAREYRPDLLVDFVITSPPYPAMADYITSQRLAYYWLGYNIDFINSKKRNEIGPRYQRHSSKKLSNYLLALTLAFSNIVEGIKVGGGAAIMLPSYPIGDPRLAVIQSFYDTLSDKMQLLYSIERNVAESFRWSPFKKLKNETLTIWSKK